MRDLHVQKNKRHKSTAESGTICNYPVTFVFPFVLIIDILIVINNIINIFSLLSSVDDLVFVFYVFEPIDIGNKKHHSQIIQHTIIGIVSYCILFDRSGETRRTVAEMGDDSSQQKSECGWDVSVCCRWNGILRLLCIPYRYSGRYVGSFIRLQYSSQPQRSSSHLRRKENYQKHRCMYGT